ncbi:MAG TPA: AAA family ATPase [Lachnospiraceae bacterium]|nr:AAA family ATPase [Lachnospiraceae bacterium]
MEERGYYQKAVSIIDEVKKAVIGKDECVLLAMTAILAGGHILIDDIPGVGKTTLAIAFAKAMNLKCMRTQFTPDVLPSDILGFTMYNKKDGQFYYQPGTVMCNLFLADEINRTSPKTQSALLEVMEEGCVTVDGVTRKVPEPFIVIATQNPAGSIGTQLLPESQLDRFMVCLSVGYPSLEDEIAIAKGRSNDIINLVGAVISGDGLIDIQNSVNEVFIKDEVYKYLCMLVRETREHPAIELGLSPRGTIALASMSKAAAFLQGRDYVIPDDVASVFNAVASHRIVPASKARMSHLSVEDILGQIKTKVKKPKSVKRFI